MRREFEHIFRTFENSSIAKLKEAFKIATSGDFRYQSKGQK
jgi:hypothetical protein